MSNYFDLKATAVRGSGGYFSVGTIIPWTSTSLTGFLVCNGGEQARATYPQLAAILNDKYGTASDNTTNFKLPNLQQKVMVGQQGNGSFVIGGTGGANTDTPSITFGSATVNVSVPNNLNVSIASQNVPLPSHTHHVFTTTEANIGNNKVTANTQSAVVRGVVGDSSQDHKYRIAPSNLSATIGKTSTGGSGNGSHNHTGNIGGSLSGSFNQSALSANSNAVDVIQPYQTVTFLIKHD
jgi:microcystin-dependent protein